MEVPRHIPVMSEEVMFWLARKGSRTYLDCTVGYSGHAEKILEASGPGSRLIGLDRDATAISASRKRLARFGDRAVLLHGHFMDLKQHLTANGIGQVDGILFDLGVSSLQLEEPARGFSFQVDGPLDMRMDQSMSGTAADLVNQWPEAQLADAIFQFGEERFSRRIARGIVRARERHALATTKELVSVIEGAVPANYRHGRLHCATRTFQAIRIAVNQELDCLEPALRDATDVLSPGGRLCVISFHSLEDRIVKHTLRALSGKDDPALVVLTKKPQIPTREESDRNPRSRSAKLRAAQRVSKEGHS
ncbi:MAG TPA: 16S rRNA (cytosine(1402)-N(4))-methyltransferase RsmH [Nitrospiraceae bacterium]|nr:16S rRNA (cytosine(1402)-N(4))-methyltransferase RsmH [Nitrospiraceae bacterium]